MLAEDTGLMLAREILNWVDAQLGPPGEALESQDESAGQICPRLAQKIRQGLEPLSVPVRRRADYSPSHSETLFFNPRIQRGSQLL